MFAKNNASEFLQRQHPAHPAPLERINQPVVLMVTVGLRVPHPPHSLDNPIFHAALLQAWKRAPEWQVGWYVIMPDHLHCFCTPGQPIRMAMVTWCRKWKSLTTAALTNPAWRWLPNCWDTQMRNREHYVEKLAYVQRNPVRKQLVTQLGQWPYQGIVHEIRW